MFVGAKESQWGKCTMFADLNLGNMWRMESANKCDIPLFSYATYVRILS